MIFLSQLLTESRLVFCSGPLFSRALQHRVFFFFQLLRVAGRQGNAELGRRTSDYLGFASRLSGELSPSLRFQIASENLGRWSPFCQFMSKAFQEPTVSVAG